MANETKSAGGNTATANKDAPLLEQIMEHTRLQPQDDGYDVARQGVEALLKELMSGQAKNEEQRVDKRLVDDMIADLDRRLSAQVDEILHHPDFQKFESAWRGLKFLVDRTDFKENIRVELFNASKEDLLDDFKDAPDITKSGLYRHVYTEEYGQFGGEPFAGIIGNFDSAPAPPM